MVNFKKSVCFKKRVCPWWRRAGDRVGQRGWGEELFNGYRGSVLQDEKGSGDWLHNNRNEFNTTELHT